METANKLPPDFGKVKQDLEQRVQGAVLRFMKEFSLDEMSLHAHAAKQADGTLLVSVTSDADPSIKHGQ